MNAGTINFVCNVDKINDSFYWAANQALTYAHSGDKVGDWYEAALPGRNAFCIRDVCHQISGAHYLGLDKHSVNMLSKFASSISKTRDYCMYWEITKDDIPAPIDYTNDNDFWYNLPANFDLIDGCLRAYKYSCDQRFLYDEIFLNLYGKTMNEYIKCWDCNGDGIPERKNFNSRRGIPSYDEQKEMEETIIATDLIAAQIRANYSLAEICKYKNENGDKYNKEATRLREILQNEWYDKNQEKFYSAKKKNSEYVSTLGSPHLLAYFNAIEKGEILDKLLYDIDRNAKSGVIVEILSYYPQIFFENNNIEKGMTYLYELINPKLKRREYPEVSFAIISSIIEGMAGVCANSADKNIIIKHRPPKEINYFKISDCPIRDEKVDIEYKNGSYTISNNKITNLKIDY